MAAYTLAQAREKLEEALAAESVVMTGAQEYAISSADGSRGATQADLKEIRESIKFWRSEVDRLEKPTNRGSVRHAVIGGV